MDMIQLQLFASIARTLNFSRTAEQFFITQPAVSHQVKKLENSLGVKLLKRSSHDVSLTAEGEEFLAYVDRILSISFDAENRIQNMASGRSGHVRVAALSSASYQLSDCLIKLYREHPSFQVDIDLLEGTEMTDALKRGSYDFFFAVVPMIPAGNEYEYAVIHEGSLELLVNKGIVTTIDLSDWSTIERYPFVSVPRSDMTLSNHITRICSERGITPNIINYYNRAESVVLSVNAGVGIAILPGELGKLYQRPNVISLPIDGEDAKIITVFIWKKGDDNIAGRIFRDTVTSLFP
ncbi:MAG: LysR family transcriptional regulator [Oscillospiraceae bacterium]|nr:LysR family transcriptional regulator [Oscillospiraceae bacterium]